MPKMMDDDSNMSGSTSSKPETEMMESEAAPSAAAASSSSGNQIQDQGGRGGVGELLAAARQLVNDGKPSQALQAVLIAMKTKGGEQAMLQSLHRARELYRQRLQETTEVDQLASLFAECAIAAEASPEPPAALLDNAISPLSNNNGPAILAETGRDQIVLDAFSDGSSFICLQCGGLVSVYRKDEHYAYWCS